LDELPKRLSILKESFELSIIFLFKIIELHRYPFNNIKSFIINI